MADWNLVACSSVERLSRVFIFLIFLVLLGWLYLLSSEINLGVFKRIYRGWGGGLGLSMNFTSIGEEILSQSRRSIPVECDTNK